MLGEQKQETRVASTARNMGLLAIWGIVTAAGRFMRSWLGALLIAGAVLVASNWGGSLIGFVTGTTGPLDFVGQKISTLLVGPSTPAAVVPSRSYGSSAIERLNEAVELYVRQTRAAAFRDPNDMVLIGDVFVMASTPQADGNYRLEIDAVFDVHPSLMGFSTGSVRQRIHLLAVENGGDHSITVYSATVVGK